MGNKEISVHIFSCNRLLQLVWCLMFFYLSFFPACRKVVIVGDSIIDDIRDIEGVTVRHFPSATIGALTYFFEDKKIDLQPTIIFLNIRTPNKFVVITLKFELCGSTIEY